MDVPRAPRMLPLICYEIIFPGEAVPGGERPGWLVNLTNDGWFGPSSGPYQHLQQARVRAIEQGLPLVRAANTGISAVIDPLGRVIGSLSLGIEGVLDASLPRPIERNDLCANWRRIGVGDDARGTCPRSSAVAFIINDRLSAMLRELIVNVAVPHCWYAGVVGRDC